jgi:hypothetical protein
MYCPNQPTNYLVWHRESEHWQPGDMIALCREHVEVASRRIHSGQIFGCDLLHSTPRFAAGAHCYWDLRWPLVSEFKTIELGA